MQKEKYEKIPYRDEFFPLKINFDSEICPEKKEQGQSSTWHEQLEIIYVIKGGALIECDHRRFLTEDGDIVVVNPLEIHSVSYGFGSPCYHCIMIDSRMYGEGALDICNLKYLTPMSDRKLMFNNLVRENIKIRAILDDLLSEYKERRPAYEMAVKGDIMKLLSELFRSELYSVGEPFVSFADPRDREPAHKRIAPAIRYIAEHYSENISLSDLVSLCAMNTASFCRDFRLVTGRSAVKYVNEYRNAKAEALLIVSDLTITEIANKVGYSDSCYFGKKFREERGITPAQIRKMARKNIKND